MQNRFISSLATSLWPRSGGDRRNSGCFSCHGPDSPNILWQIPLDDPPLDHCRFQNGCSGCIVAQDGNLRVVHRGMLRSVSGAGRVVWKRGLRFHCQDVTSCGLPLALNDGSVWITSNWRLLCERNGRLALVAHGAFGDDSATSPNLGYDGSIYCGGFESASRWHNGRATTIDKGGYDIHGPAVYSDSSVGLASYYGNGLCRLAADGTRIFQVQTESLQQDGLVTLNELDEAACMSINDRHSLGVDGQGNVLWTFPMAATFTCYPNGWIALSKKHLTRLSNSGRVVWSRELLLNKVISPRQAVVDDRGLIYVPSPRGLDVYDGFGKLLFSSDFEPGDTSTLCPFAPGQMALIHNCSLYLIGQP